MPIIHRLSIWPFIIFLTLAGCQSPSPAAPLAAATTIVPSPTTTLSPQPTATFASSVTPIATPTPTPAYPVYNGPPLNRAQIGVQIYLHRQDVSHLIQQLQALHVGWVKVQVSWKLHEPTPGQYDEAWFAELDALVAAAHANDMAILLSVSKAPEWSRPTNELDGPPLDNTHFRQFMQELAHRYQGQVAAYELWNEPNLQREWAGMPLDAAAFTALIQAGAEGVRVADPLALVISGAPAVTGINDGLAAVDDRLYFRAMLAAGVGQVVDGLGVHPYGWANPPDSTVSQPDAAATSHNDHPSFFFQDTLREYGTMLTEFGLEEKHLWVTEFGWGSFEQLGATPPPEAAFMDDVSEWQQAVYLQRALELAHQWPWVGPMFIWNLNFAPGIGPEFSESGYSLLRPDGSRRPAYFALANIPKQ